MISKIYHEYETLKDIQERPYTQRGNRNMIQFPNTFIKYDNESNQQNNNNYFIQRRKSNKDKLLQYDSDQGKFRMIACDLFFPKKTQSTYPSKKAKNLKKKFQNTDKFGDINSNSLKMLSQCLKRFNLFDKLIENYESMKKTLPYSQKKWLSIPKSELINIFENNSNFISSNMANFSLSKKIPTNKNKEIQINNNNNQNYRKKSSTNITEDKLQSTSTFMFPIAQKMNLMPKNFQIRKKEKVVQTAESNIKVVEMLKKYKQFKDNPQQIKNISKSEKLESNTHIYQKAESKSNLLCSSTKMPPRSSINPSKDNRIKPKGLSRKIFQIGKHKSKNQKLKNSTNKEIKGNDEENHLINANSQLKDYRKSLNDLDNKKGSNSLSVKAHLKNETFTDKEIFQSFNNDLNDKNYKPIVHNNIKIINKNEGGSLSIAPNLKKNYTIIGEGNNSDIVRKCFIQRKSDWEEISYYNKSFNFKWVCSSKMIQYNHLLSHTSQLVNHFENHFEITNKDLLFKNLQTICEKNKTNVFDILPLTIILDLNEKNYTFQLEKFENLFYIVKQVIEKINKEDKVYYEKILSQVNSRIINLPIFNEKKIPIHCTPKINETHLLDQNLWIIKPTGFNRGRGVVVFDTIELLKKLIKEFSEGIQEIIINNQQQEYELSEIDILLNTLGENEEKANEEPPKEYVKSNSFIIQKYIEQPLLINKRKFDIRTWVLIDQYYKIYLFKEGYIRTSSMEFSLDKDSILNKGIHLTNNAVQKFCNEYGKFEEGNQLSFCQFQKYLDDNFPKEKLNVKTNFYFQMKELIKLSIKSLPRKFFSNEKSNSFEVFGYDFIIDYKFKVWLIEVNTNPCLEESSSILKVLLPRMINDLFKLTIDKNFPLKSSIQNSNTTQTPSESYHVPGYSDNENMFELIYQIDNFSIKNKPPLGFH